MRSNLWTWQGSQIIQIEGTNTYYIAVDVGDTMYFYEVHLDKYNI